MSEKHVQSLLSIKDISLSQIQKLFSLSLQLKTFFESSYPLLGKKSEKDLLEFPSLEKMKNHFSSKVMVQAYFEPSTRTKISFELAAKRIGLSVIHQDFTDLTSSQRKGESPWDSLKVLKSMNPDLLVVRYDGSSVMNQALGDLQCPCINAGGGSGEHPTQALLDVFTVLEARKLLDFQNFNRTLLEKERVLFIGDVFHSRVAHSSGILFKRLGAHLGVCTLEPLFKKDQFFRKALFFNDLQKGLRWATLCVVLRWQKERHSDLFFNFYTKKEILAQKSLNLERSQKKKGYPYQKEKKEIQKNFQTQNKKREEKVKKDFYRAYQVNQQMLKSFSKEGLILHSGPVIWGEELSEALKQESRLKVYDQVLNGVYTRMALLRMCLEDVS